MYQKPMLGFIYLFVMLIFLVGCGLDAEFEQDPAEVGSSDQRTEESSQFLIYTSLYPLYEFAGQIAGDRADIVNLIPTGTEPHDFEPTARDVINLSQADLFIYNGGGFESWIERILEAVDSSTMKVVDASANIHLLKNKETGIDHDHADEHEKHDHGQFDAHVWLDPLLAKQQAAAIKEALVDIDPDYKAYYQDNFTQLAQALDELHLKYKKISDTLSTRDFVISHASFGYLAERYHLNQIAISGLTPSNEPSGHQLQEIITFVRENGIQYILFENLVTPKVAEIVREEVGADALVLHNLEGLTEEELSQGKDYFSLMEDNLEVLKRALRYDANDDTE